MDNSKTEAINTSSTAACNYLCLDATPTDEGDQLDSDLLDFMLDFDATFEEEHGDDELDSTTQSIKQEKKMKKALKQLYEALRDVFPHQLAESSGFIEDMVNEILACPPSDDFQAGLMDLMALSKDKDAIKRATGLAARKWQINEKKFQCSKLKATMQQHAVRAKKLVLQQTELKKRREILQSELEKVDSKLSDLPATIAQEKSMGMAADGKTLAEHVLKAEAGEGDLGSGSRCTH